MPYISQDRRAEIDSGTDRPHSAGDLNYLLTEVVMEYVDHQGLAYQTINDVMGAFASAAQEFYRRVAAPYEDIKRAQNGDVYS